METLTWHQSCLFCRRPITRGRPTIIFSIIEPGLIGLSHSTCCAAKYNYGNYQMHPPNYLSEEYLSFLVQFWPRLYSLPGADQPNGELRWALARLVRSTQKIPTNPTYYFEEFKNECRRWHHRWMYTGDIETDFFKFLGETLKLAKVLPIGIDVDFRKSNK